MQPQDASPLIQSQATGATEPLLIEQTIGAFFDTMVQRQPGIKTTFRRHPGWWGGFDGNVQEIMSAPGGKQAAERALAAGCDIALNCWAKMDDMTGICERAGAMSAAATTRRLLDPGVTSDAFGNPSHDGQTDAGPPASRRQALKDIENTFTIDLFDTWSIVADPVAHDATRLFAGNINAQRLFAASMQQCIIEGDSEKLQQA